MGDVIEDVLGGIGDILGGLIGGLIGLGLSYLLGGDESSESSEYASDHGLRVNTRSTSEPIKIIYGKQRVGGNDVFYETSGVENKYLWMVQTLCEGRIEGIDTDSKGDDRIWLGNERVQKYEEFVDYWIHKGTKTQSYDTNLNAVKSKWTDEMHYTAYIVWKLTWDQNNFQGVPKRQSLVKGLRLYDPRDGTRSWSQNAALAVYDFLTNGRYGYGISPTRLDVDSVKDAANYIDAKGWKLNVAFARDDSARTILNTLLATFRGSFTYFNNKLYLRYSDLNYESSVLTINDRDILTDNKGKARISISQPSSHNKPDAVAVRFIDKSKDYTVDEIPIGDSLGRINTLDLLAVTNKQQALDLGVYALERQRLNRIISLVGRDHLVKLDPYDIITLNTSAFSISDQLMRVIASSITSDGFVRLDLQYEDLILYDDDYNLDEDNIYEVDLPDPGAEPPSVENVSVIEEVYEERLRSFSRLKISFDQPSDYIWFDHIEVWQSFDNASWLFLFNASDDFVVERVEEGQTYYIILRVVSIHGIKEIFNNAFKVSEEIDGKSKTAPPSLSTLSIIVGRNNSVTIYSGKLSSPDIEVYEFRLGASWSGAIFLASLRSPNLTLNLVKPGNHTFYCNTLGTNGKYGANPVSAAITLPDPPDAYSVITSKTFANMITNGSMELDSNWANVGTPSANVRAFDKAHGETYSRKFTVDAVDEGIQSDVWTSVNGRKYGCGLWVFPDIGITSVRVRIRAGDNSGWVYNQDHTGLTAEDWNELRITYSEGGLSGGSGAYLQVLAPTGVSSGSWWVDDVCLLEGDFTDNMMPVLYNEEPYIKCAHVGGVYTGSWASPEFDLGSLARYLVYILSDIVVTGEGTLWKSQAPPGIKWSDLQANTKKWSEIWELSSSPAVEMEMYYGAASPPGNIVKKLEILGAIIDTQYYKIKYTITDPQPQVYAYAEAPVIKFCQ
jgi:hypothetical protein